MKLALQLTDQYHNELIHDLLPAVEGRHSTYAEDTTPVYYLESNGDHSGYYAMLYFYNGFRWIWK